MRHVFYMITLISLIATPLNTVTANTSSLSQVSAQNAIKEFNNHRQRLINSPNFFHEAVSFYHHHIDENATFEMVINDQRPDVPQQKIRLNKTQFLQSFLEEGQRLRSYKQNYNIVSFETASTTPNAFVVKEKIFEQGIIPSYQMGDDTSVSFTTISFCTSTYHMQNSAVIQTGSRCQTSVDFPKDI